MRIGWNGGGHFRSVEAIRERACWAADQGFASFWLSQIAGPDSLTALAAIGNDAPGIELGTSVVPLYGRHPFVLASQALATQDAVGGRLVLGIGPSHRRYAEHMLGGSYERPFTRTREELHALEQLMAGEVVDSEGAEVTVRGQLAIDAPAPPILVAALAPRMLALAGRHAAGTALWMVGPKTLAEHITPRIQTAAAAPPPPPPPRAPPGGRGPPHDPLRVFLQASRSVSPKTCPGPAATPRPGWRFTGCSRPIVRCSNARA